MNPTARWVLAIVLLQAVLIGAYWFVERERTPDAADSLGTEPPRHVDRPMPELTAVHRDGSRSELSALGRRTLVHIWATWCPPCRAELPGLLGVGSRHDVGVVALALDENWDAVEPFLGDIDSSNVALAASKDVERALGVTSLPVTLLLEADGRVTLRFDGARDWTDEAFVRTYIEDPVDDR